ncbi:MAG: RHS repeat-associated core domain-containing protein [Polyangiaceae bacterium]
MPHLSTIAYSPFDQMVEADLGGGGTAYFVYDASGQRVRKVHEHSSSTLVEERIYLGGYELYRKHDSSGMLLERQTLHVMDGTRRVAMVETKTIEDDIAITDPAELWRFQLDNHLGSACLELDDAGAVISYEEYHPFGTSAYRAANASEVSERRYRYIGKERDEETGFYSMGVRYYAPWLGRWTTADPAGIGADGPGLYTYCRGNPVGLRDPNGRESSNGAISQMTDPQLIQHVKSLTPEKLEDFLKHATGNFSIRAEAAAKNLPRSITIEEVTIEGTIQPKPDPYVYAASASAGVSSAADSADIVDTARSAVEALEGSARSAAADIGQGVSGYTNAAWSDNNPLNIVKQLPTAALGIVDKYATVASVASGAEDPSALVDVAASAYETASQGKELVKGILLEPYNIITVLADDTKTPEEKGAGIYQAVKPIKDALQLYIAAASVPPTPSTPPSAMTLEEAMTELRTPPPGIHL